jgi:hypothetical protein
MKKFLQALTNQRLEKPISEIPAEKPAQIFSPISFERTVFLRERIQVLQSMYNEFLQKPAKYVVGGQHELQRSVLSTIMAEKLQLMVELNVLSEHLEKTNV